jgi:CheY-like chemotaxis protein
VTGLLAVPASQPQAHYIRPVREEAVGWEPGEIEAAAEFGRSLVTFLLRQAEWRAELTKELERLVDDLLNFSGLTRAPLQRTRVDMRKLFEEAWRLYYRQNRYAEREPGDPAVILPDLKLPKVDGLEVLEKVKGDPEHRQIPVVMLTSSREERDLIRSYDLGGNAFVVKPMDFNAFFEAIRDLGVFWAAVLNEPPPRGPRPPR